MIKVEEVNIMSEKKTQKRSESKGASFLSKVLAFLKRAFYDSFRNMGAELKKVSWPSRKDLFNYSIIVVSFMVLMAVVIGLLDMGSVALMQELSK